MSWTKILIRILEGEQNIPSPFHKEGYLKPLFIITNRETRKGYGYILCSITRKGVWLSNMIVPDKPGIGWVYREELSKFSPIHFELKDFNKNFSPEMENMMKR